MDIVMKNAMRQLQTDKSLYDKVAHLSSAYRHLVQPASATSNLGRCDLT
jgi:hypothetical protein